MTNSYTVTSLTAGTTYQFTVEARNTEGFSAYADPPVTVLAAQAPGSPFAPTTTIDGDLVNIQWNTPSDNGSPIQGYMVYIMHGDLTSFSVDATHCDGSLPSVIASTECDIPISTLRAGAFQLPWGSSIYAKVNAYNLYGSSKASPLGNGAVILTYPDPPANVSEDSTQRTSNSITVIWDEAFNGGATILDYRVSFDQGTGVYVVLTEAVTQRKYTAITLTSGITYNFKIEARNVFGYSQFSDVVPIICATTPSKPATPYSLRSGGDVVIAWVQPRTNGLYITSY